LLDRDYHILVGIGGWFIGHLAALIDNVNAGTTCFVQHCCERLHVVPRSYVIGILFLLLVAVVAWAYLTVKTN
jgi:hypothetical protein